MTNQTVYRWFQGVFWGAYSAIGIWETSQSVGLQPHIVLDFVLYCGYCIGLTELLRRHILRRCWLDYSAIKLVGLAFLSSLALAPLQTALVVATDLLTSLGRSAFLSDPIIILMTFLGVATMNLYWFGLYCGFKTRSLGKERQVHLELALKEAELRALEAQINPHFLFNCLNSIRALVTENPARAQEMITRFAALLRYSLNRDRQHTVRLSEEAEIVADYLALESARFDDRLRVQLAIDEDAKDVQVPPMILQSLVENALKHGVARRTEGGDVRVHASAQNGSLVLEVENPGDLAATNSNGTQIGLNNIRERLRLLYGDRARLSLENREGGRVLASVQIPR